MQNARHARAEGLRRAATRSTDEIARLKLATMGVDDRQAHRGAGAATSPRGTKGRSSAEACAPARPLEPERIVRLEADAVVLLDQRRLPDEEVELACRSAAEVADAIRTLAVRGAPAIGSPPRTGYALAAARGEDLDEADARPRATSRPTAVNLAWALDEMRADPDARARARDSTPTRSSAAGAWPRTRPSCSRPGSRALTHCNAGGARDRRLRHARSARCARPGSAGCVEHVWVDETRPLLQGARLTAWELERARHPARRHRRLGRGVADGARRGRLRRHGRRPDRRERRHREQDRHVRARRARARTTASRSTSWRRPRRSTSATPTGADIPIEERDRRRGHGALRRAQPRVRRHARRADRGDRHRGRASTARPTRSRCRRVVAA